jgi:hypothetical protein
MAEHDELAQLREDLTQQQAASITLIGIVKSIDQKVDELAGMAKATQIESSIIEARLTTVDRRLDAVKLDMTNSFSQLAAYQIQAEKRLDARLDAMATKQDLAAMEDRILGAFQNLMDVVSERLPKKGD